MKIKSFTEFIYEKNSDDFISIFDLDDCLVVTKAKIKVYDPADNMVYELTPAEFNKYEKRSHHHLDFSEFDDHEILMNGRPIKWVLNILKNTMNKQKKVGIITARSDKKIVIDFLEKHGVKLDHDLVFAINNPSSKYKGTNAEKKKQAFEDLIKMGYRKFRFFDDNLDNLKQVKELEQEYEDVKIEIKQILDKWIPKFRDL